MNNNHVTVAVTAFRRPEMLRRALSSVRAAGLKAVCASGDANPGVVAVLEEFGVPCDICRDGDRTCNGDWLAAARLVKTPFMVLLHDDDELLPCFGEKLKGLVGQADKVVIWNAVLREAGKADVTMSILPGERTVANLARHLMANQRSLSPIHACWQTQHVVRVLEECEAIRRENLVPEMMTRPGMMVGNDLLLWLRLAETMRGIVVEETPLVVCHSHPDSETTASVASEERGRKLHAAYAAVKAYFVSICSRKIRLRGVTAVIMEGTDPNGAARVLNHCSRFVEFDEVKLLAPRRPTVEFGGEFVQIPVFNYIGYSTLSTKALWHYIDTEHALVMQRDGFIINPSLWDPRWLAYDYIGAPWANVNLKEFAKPAWRVGNSGFSLRSRRFMKLCGQLPFDHNNEGDREIVRRTPATDICADDVWMCQRPEVVEAAMDAGCRYAPVETAAVFSMEGDIPEYPPTFPSFGFHAFAYGREKYRSVQAGGI